MVELGGPTRHAKFRRVVELTNYDLPSPGWKIAIGSLITSALAAFAKYPLTTTSKRFFFLFLLLLSLVFLLNSNLQALVWRYLYKLLQEANLRTARLILQWQ